MQDGDHRAVLKLIMERGKTSMHRQLQMIKRVNFMDRYKGFNL